MKIIIWDLPKEQIAFLQKNCKAQFETGKICVMEQKTAEQLLEQLRTGELLAEDLMIISENAKILREAVAEGMTTVGYLGECADILPVVDMLVEGFEEVDDLFLERVFQRHHNIPWKILETKRLLVRELTLQDLDALFELYAYEGMTDYMEDLYPYEKEYEYQKAYIDSMYRFFGYGMWLVFEKESGRLVGRAGVEHREALQGELELGYAIGTPWQEKGYATEVCWAILRYVEEELGFEEICSLVLPENVGSIHLLEKLGFHETEELTLDEIRYKKYKKIL